MIIFGWSLLEGFVEPIIEGLTNLGSESTTAATTSSTSAIDNFRTVRLSVYINIITMGGLISLLV